MCESFIRLKQKLNLVWYFDTNHIVHPSAVLAKLDQNRIYIHVHRVRCAKCDFTYWDVTERRECEAGGRASPAERI